MPTKPTPLVYALAALLALAFCLALSASASTTSAAVPPPTSQDQAPPPTEQQARPTGNDILGYPLRGLPPGALLPFGQKLFAQADASSPAKSSPQQGGECVIEDPSQNVGSLNNTLADVAVVNNTDAWAVGSYSTTETTLDSMIQRFDGTQWNLVPEPGFMTNTNYLQGVTAISANDVWAVGAVKSGSRMETLVEHWDGTAWSRVPSPNPGSGDNVLFGVNGDAADNVWAVGIYIQSSLRTLVLRWNGTAWSQVPSANPGGFVNFLVDVEMIPSAQEVSGKGEGGSNEVWAVGYYLSGSLFAQTLIQRFDGTQFVVVPSPNVNTLDNFLYGIDSLSPTQIWVAGHYHDSALFRTLIMRWDGTAWTIEPSENAPGNNYLFDIDMYDPGSRSANGPQTGIAVGGHQNGGESGPIELKRINEWAFLAITLFQAEFRAVERDPLAAAFYAFMAGYLIDPSDTADGSRTTWMGRYFDSCNPQPTPTPGGPTLTPTHTPTPAPPSATPTPCTPGQFSDVPPGSTFYPFITCLVNEGIISGYPDCTFRPNNNVTRGQIAKIVSNAAAFSDPVSGQTFEDVPTGSTFYDFVERLVLHEVMSGYACGGPGEPCVPPTNRPYFRPNGSTTRGQMTKIVSNAAGFNDPIPAGQYTFTDVPEGSTFHTFGERLLLNRPGTMSGYPCGGPGEPCDGLNRPYFRPANTLTRGQASKIVANTFFPSCSPR